MCYEASSMPMQPDRFSESQRIASQPLSQAWRAFIVCSLLASMFPVYLFIYERRHSRQSVLTCNADDQVGQLLQLERQKLKILASHYERQQPIAPCRVPSNSASPPTKTNETVPVVDSTMDARISRLEKQLEEKLTLISEIKGRTDVQDRKIAELGTQAAGIKAMTEQMNRKIPDLELRCKATEDQLSKKVSEALIQIEKQERQIKFQTQRLDGLNNTVQARIKADSR